MSYLDACLVQHGGVFLGAAGRGEYDGHTIVDEQVHQAVDLGVHQRHVHAPRLGGGRLHFVDVFL